MRDDRGRRVERGPGVTRETVGVGVACFVIGTVVGAVAMASFAIGSTIVVLFFFGLIMAGLMYATDLAFRKAGDPPTPLADCRACGFSLVGLHRAQDGCTVCPECGHAWRLGARTQDPPTIAS